MPLGDINRSGPNQDFNDPTSIVEVSEKFQEASDAIYEILEEPVLEIIFPVSIEDGSTEIINSVDARETFSWPRANINTYIFLAEEFRDYWNTLNNRLDDVAAIPLSGIVSVDNIGGGPITQSGSLGNDTVGILITYFDNSFCHTKNISGVNIEGSFDEPIWSGIGPVNYNSGTYPQLLLESERIIPEPVFVSSTNLGCENYESQTLDINGKNPVFTSNPFIGTERHDSPTLTLDTVIGRKYSDITSTVAYPSTSDFIVFNTTDEDISISYLTSIELSVEAEVVHSSGPGTAVTFIGGVGATVDSLIQVKATGIESVAFVSSWPDLHTNSDGDSSSDNSNPLSILLQATISGSFILGPKQKCVIRIISLVDFDGADIPIDDAAAGPITITGTYIIDGTSSSTISFGDVIITRSINRNITE